MEQSGKRSPQSEFWNIREKGRRSGKKVVTHSMVPSRIVEEAGIGMELRGPRGETKGGCISTGGRRELVGRLRGCVEAMLRATIGRVVEMVVGGIFVAS